MHLSLQQVFPARSSVHGKSLLPLASQLRDGTFDFIPKSTGSSFFRIGTPIWVHIHSQTNPHIIFIFSFPLPFPLADYFPYICRFKSFDFAPRWMKMDGFHYPVALLETFRMRSWGRISKKWNLGASNISWFSALLPFGKHTKSYCNSWFSH